MTTNAMNETPWQKSIGALVVLAALLVTVFGWVWIASWPMARAGHQGAVENLLTSFAFGAIILAALAVGFRRPHLVTIGAPVWAVAFYLSSLFFGDMVQGHNVGTAIRVGALSVLAFSLAAGWLWRKR